MSSSSVVSSLAAKMRTDTLLFSMYFPHCVFFCVLGFFVCFVVCLGFFVFKMIFHTVNTHGQAVNTQGLATTFSVFPEHGS